MMFETIFELLFLSFDFEIQWLYFAGSFFT